MQGGGGARRGRGWGEGGVSIMNLSIPEQLLNVSGMIIT
jgi:hypothetical protein